MHLQVVSRYFLEDHALWGEPGGSSILSGTHAVDFPDLSGPGGQALMDLEYDVRLMLGCLKPGESAVEPRRKWLIPWPLGDDDTP